MFQLSPRTLAPLKSQTVIASWGGARRARPYAFTEQGVAMLSSVLRTKRALRVRKRHPDDGTPCKNTYELRSHECGHMKLTRLALVVFGGSLLIGCPKRQGDYAFPPEPLEIQTSIVLPLVGCDNGTTLPGYSAAGENAPTAHCLDTTLNRGLASTLPLSIDESLSDVEVGTVVVASLSEDRIILAADSRSTLRRNGRYTGAYRDDACKIVELKPDLLMAITGMAATGPLLPTQIQYDAQLLGKEAAKNFRFDARFMEKNRTIQEIAAKWGWDVAFRIHRGVLANVYRPHGRVWVEGIFAGREPNGELGFAVARVTYLPTTFGVGAVLAAPQITVHALPRDFTWIEAFGMREVANSYTITRLVPESKRDEFLRMRQLVKANPGEFDESLPILLVQKTINEDLRAQFRGGPKFVGGPIDVAVLDQQGTIRWTQRKPICTNPK